MNAHPVEFFGMVDFSPPIAIFSEVFGCVDVDLAVLATEEI